VGAPAGVDRGAATRVAGHGAQVYPDAFELPVLEPSYPTPRGLALAAAHVLATGAEPAPLTPLYLRRPDAKEPGERKRVSA
jgi:tRNA A37 threonylcarbamoyladenosine modification protein TsaB